MKIISEEEFTGFSSRPKIFAEHDKTESNNPNWKGGVSKIKNVREILDLPEEMQTWLRQRLLDSMKFNVQTQCWEWTKSVFKSNGRARFSLGVSFLAARVAYVLWVGDVEKFCVCHTCDNVLCINPHHLFLGTNKNNSEDMIRKGREASGDRNGSRKHPEKLRRGDNHPSKFHIGIHRGEKNGMARLTEVQVKEIKKKYIPYRSWKKPSNQKQLAEEYGVPVHIIRDIAQGNSWTHI